MEACYKVSEFLAPRASIGNDVNVCGLPSESRNPVVRVFKVVVLQRFRGGIKNIWLFIHDGYLLWVEVLIRSRMIPLFIFSVCGYGSGLVMQSPAAPAA